MKIPLLILTFCLTSLSGVRAVHLKLTITDQQTGERVPARVLIKDGSGNSYFPHDAVTLQIGSEVWFMSSGESLIEIDAREVMLRVERGKEYRRIKKYLKFHGRKLVAEEIKLVRWINMKARGYLSGDNHMHKPPAEVVAYVVAEDLDFGSVLSWWRGPEFSVSPDGGFLRKMHFGDVTVPVSVYDVEMEDDWGATYLFGIRQPFPFEDDNSRPHLQGAKFAREQRALICYQAGWSREVLPDALLGLVDVVNVCNNNFHMHRYQPRSMYSNLLEIKEFRVYPNTPEGMMEMNTETYYRLLNCGLKLEAGAGSAIGAKETPAGYNRAYVRCTSEKGFKGFLEAWRGGKNFVTNGPMLFFRSSEGLRPGDSLNIAGSKNITFLIDIQSDSPLQTVEIMINGEVVKSFPLPVDVRSFSGQVSLEIAESAWVCARATDTDMLLSDKELEEYRSPRKRLYQEPCRLRYAHTSPIYIYRNGKEIAVVKSMKEGLQMLGVFKEYVRNNAGKSHKKSTLAAVEKATAILKAKLESAGQIIEE